MRTATLESNGTKFYDRVGDTPKAEAVEQLKRNDLCKQNILRHFDAHPFDKINALRLAEIYGGYTYLTYRSRLTELKDSGYIVMLPDTAKSHGGKQEHLWELRNKPTAEPKRYYVQAVLQFN